MAEGKKSGVKKEMLGNDLINLAKFGGEEFVTRTYVFIPSEGKSMKVEYPELDTIDEFLPLSNAEMCFVWLLGNRTSHLCKENRKDSKSAMGEALKLSELDKILPATEYQEYMNWKLPPSIQAAISRMRNFIPSLRMRAKLTNERMFNNLEKMSSVSEEEIADMDVDDKKKYSAFVKEAAQTMEELIPQIESAWGTKELKIVKKARKDGSNGPTIMDLVIQQS